MANEMYNEMRNHQQRDSSFGGHLYRSQKEKPREGVATPIVNLIKEGNNVSGYPVQKTVNSTNLNTQEEYNIRKKRPAQLRERENQFRAEGKGIVNVNFYQDLKNLPGKRDFVNEESINMNPIKRVKTGLEEPTMEISEKEFSEGVTVPKKSESEEPQLEKSNGKLTQFI